ncbi:LacI family DNA-binding transcriptional regulator [Paenibacillus filicis]|uniref:LacI family DNA-binding transcriptional regulator n=1 Tax=Paenibacillus gyeongsangnamensis TaxID=3388067 RepID=A0ABT4QIW5_9BACL|nr:LacI family DNA-binding transcriptional regulator [Paenibacillus filicis]MCZ8516821.1 LacI family DNA-binding transcriptional regulator [Paenibacillus filicis]
MSRNRQVTIVDIAQAAGVSIATVSNVLNRRNVPMAEETIRKVEEAAERLGYRRNVMAASLSRRKSYELGLLVPGFGGYYGLFAESMQRIAHQFGYHLSVFSSGGFDPEIEKRHLEVLLQRRVDGLVCHGLAMSQETTRQLVGDGTPLVLFNGWGWPSDLAVAAVNLDFAQGSREAVKYLYERGCKKLFYLARSGSHAIDEQRRIGFNLGVSELPSEVEAEILEYSDGKQQAALERLEAVASDEAPIGILAFDDFVALTFMSHVQRSGYRVPEHFRIIGINNDPISSHTYPALTTIEIPYDLQARLAIRVMMRQLGEDEKLIRLPDERGDELMGGGAHEIRIPLKLIPRRSTEA